MIKYILSLIIMSHKDKYHYTYDNWKWVGQNYENKIAFPIGSKYQQVCDTKDIKYLRGDMKEQIYQEYLRTLQNSNLKET